MSVVVFSRSVLDEAAVALACYNSENVDSTRLWRYLGFETGRIHAMRVSPETTCDVVNLSILSTTTIDAIKALLELLRPRVVCSLLDCSSKTIPVGSIVVSANCQWLHTVFPEFMPAECESLLSTHRRVFHPTKVILAEEKKRYMAMDAEQEPVYEEGVVVTNGLSAIGQWCEDFGTPFVRVMGVVDVNGRKETRMSSDDRWKMMSDIAELFVDKVPTMVESRKCYVPSPM